MRYEYCYIGNMWSDQGLQSLNQLCRKEDWRVVEVGGYNGTLALLERELPDPPKPPDPAEVMYEDLRKQDP